MKFVPSQVISLKKSADHSEKDIQEFIADNTQILGLGELRRLSTERRQLNGGRLDLLLDDEITKVRYTVELQLGATDETHIIRTIEYWDNERTRNPHIDHVAVIVAEDITSRFLNVISLFNKAIPLIALQLSAIEIDGNVTLNCVKVLDLSTSMGWEDENTSAPATDRAYWLKTATPETVEMADKLLETVHEVVGNETLKLNYNKYYIGLASGGVANNFISMKPRKKNLLLQVKIPRTDEATALIEQSLELISYDNTWGLYQVRITHNDLVENKEVIRDLISRAADYRNGRTEDN